LSRSRFASPERSEAQKIHVEVPNLAPERVISGEPVAAVRHGHTHEGSPLFGILDSSKWRA
jgi:hypothetical protein